MNKIISVAKELLKKYWALRVQHAQAMIDSKAYFF